MSGQIANDATNKAVARLAGPVAASGPGAAGAYTQPGGTGMQVLTQNVAADLAERSGPVQYPVISVYCEKIVNDLHEKFRSFSGHAQLSVEVRHSQDRLDGLDGALSQIADVVTAALDASRGDWGDGMFYAGGYEVTFGSVKRGGRNFLQAAKITFEVGVSRN